jgi:very-short-patch-repair endonuclease
MQTIRARQLRREMTDAERLLWFLLRNRRLSGCKFRRQHPIGPYIADFVCLHHWLIVEADGGQHAEARLHADETRTTWLEAQGWRMIRFWNGDILQRQNDVLEAIVREIGGAVE